MAEKKKTVRSSGSVRKKREQTLGYLANEYKDSLLYTGELKRALDNIIGPIPEDSPHRYVRMEVGDAITSYLTRTNNSRSIKELVSELESGGCIFGVIKSPTEIVTKVVKAYIQSGRLEWADRNQTLVGLSRRTARQQNILRAHSGETEGE